MSGEWRTSRRIVERIVIEGTLELITATSLSNGDADGLTDISLIKDEVSGNALLTGTSICGALRNYLRECENGFWNENETKIAETLFGWTNDEDGSLSLLIIDDAISSKKPKTDLRDGVRIDGKTRTAEAGKKFDLEVLEPETEFLLRFELLITEKIEPDKVEYLKALATALKGFELCEINLGGRKRRGYGECKVEKWKVKRYDLKTSSELLEWLKNNDKRLNGITEQPILTAFGILSTTDERNYFELDAAFAIDGSVLIRSGSKISDKYQPDSVHLRSNGKPIISGTTLAGVLRHRAFKICNTVGNEIEAKKFVDRMFGVGMDSRPDDKWASRLEIKEKKIKEENTNSLVQTRVKIDRFTGGAFESALFDAAPVFSDGEKEAVRLSFRLRFKHDQDQSEKEAEIGLLLLLLKDLWTSDLAIGGESSIGRGRLKGKTACLNNKNGNGSWQLNMEAIDDDKVKIDGIENNTEKTEFLNKFVGSFNETLNPKEQNDGE